MHNFRKYDDFKPIDYLYQFYSKENKENKFLLKFYIDSAATLKNQWNKDKKNIIDLSGGPSLFSVIPFSSIAKTINFTDYLDINLDVIRFWLNKKEFFNWDPIIESTIQIERTIYENDKEHQDIFPKIIEDRKESIRKKLNHLFQVDLKSLHIPVQQYDLVLNNFVSECITNNSDEFLFVMQNILNYIKPDGFLLFSFFLEAKYLKIGSSYYQTYYLTYDFITRILDHYHLKIIKLDRMNSIFHYGYKEIMCVLVQNHQKQNSIIISRQIPLIHTFNLLFKKFKEKKIYFNGMFDKITFFNFIHFKVQYQFSSNFFNIIKYKDFKLLYDKYNFYIPLDSLAHIEEYLELLDIDKQFYNINLLKNKSFYFRKLLKHQLEDFKEVKLTNDFIYITLKDNVSNYNFDVINNLLEEYFSPRYFIIKNFIYLPIYELINLIDIDHLKKIISFLKNENYLIDIVYENLNSQIKLKLKKHNKIILLNNNIIDLNFQRFNERNFLEEKELKKIRLITFNI